MEKHVLQKIYNAYCGDIKDGEELAKIGNKLKTELLSKLEGEENTLFNKFAEACEEREAYSSYESFKQGFRASIMLMIEAFN
ncbi:MAG: hypothetical protein FWE74_00745 [Oscillospiraceae bacterium]|nr:hypothetical protein [Oscillospiraceae bacterium]